MQLRVWQLWNESLIAAAPIYCTDVCVHVFMFIIVCLSARMFHIRTFFHMVLVRLTD